MWEGNARAQHVDHLCREKGTDLLTEIRHMLNAGVSNRGIARHLTEVAGIPVAPRSVDRWVAAVKASA